MGKKKNKDSSKENSPRPDLQDGKTKKSLLLFL